MGVEELFSASIQTGQWCGYAKIDCHLQAVQVPWAWFNPTIEECAEFEPVAHIYAGQIIAEENILEYSTVTLFISLRHTCVIAVHFCKTQQNPKTI